jgi:hypothetical protein
MPVPLEPHTLEAFPETAEPEFVEAPEVEVLARTLLARHEELVSLAAETQGEDATISIAYVFDTAPFDPAKDEVTHETLGKATKASPLWRCLTDHHAVIAIRRYFWERFDESRRSAVLFHHLLHVEVTGPGKIRIRKHSVEEFTAVVARYGPYLPDRKAFVDAAAAWEPTPEQRASASEQAAVDAARELRRGLKPGESITITHGERTATLHGPALEPSDRPACEGSNHVPGCEHFPAPTPLRRRNGQPPATPA